VGYRSAQALRTTVARVLGPRSARSAAGPA